jgi:hypothetical protein
MPLLTPVITTTLSAKFEDAIFASLLLVDQVSKPCDFE